MSQQGSAAPRHRRWARHSLLVRLLAICVAIAGSSIGATAWIASVSTSGSIQQQYSEDFTAGAQIYDALLGYAASHPSWTEVGRSLSQLAEKTGRDITLTTESGRVLASSTGSKRLPAGAKAASVVNPLAVSAFPGRAAPSGGVDPRAVGPYRLTEAEQRTIRTTVERAASCLTRRGYAVSLDTLPNGRTTLAVVNQHTAQTPALVLPSSATQTPTGKAVTAPPANEGPPRKAVTGCVVLLPPRIVQTEIKANLALVELANACLARRGEALLGGDLTSTPLFDGTVSKEPLFSTPCVDTARRELLAKYVAPPALLYVTGSTPAAPRDGLSADAKYRIGFAALLIMVLTVGVCAIAASRLVRPLQALTTAAQRIGRGDRTARVVTRDGGQIGELAGAFNRMSEELDAAEARRKQMVSDIAHELRTPLGNIRGWLEATQDGVVTFDAPLAKSLLDESMLLQRVIEDLQELALADAGELVFHPEPMEMSALLQQVAAAHRAGAESAEIELTVSCPAPIQLTADVARLRQALGNLVSNAIRYTPPGGLVGLRAERTGNEVTIEASDTGIGIRADELPHVFDRFWRAEQSRSRLSGGSGLGLAITRHLVEAHGGTITVRSDVNGGTVFTIRLPLRD